MQEPSLWLYRWVPDAGHFWIILQLVHPDWRCCWITPPQVACECRVEALFSLRHHRTRPAIQRECSLPTTGISGLMYRRYFYEMFNVFYFIILLIQVYSQATLDDPSCCYEFLPSECSSIGCSDTRSGVALVPVCRRSCATWAMYVYVFSSNFTILFFFRFWVLIVFVVCCFAYRLSRILDSVYPTSSEERAC